MAKKINYKEWEESLNKSFKFWKFQGSVELKALDGAFKKYDTKKNQQNKAEVEEKLKNFRKSTNFKCKNEIGKLKDAIENIEFTLKMSQTVSVQTGRLPQPVAIVGGIYTGYRGDEREPSKIKKIGFDLWPVGQQTLTSQGGVAGWFKQTVFKRYKNSGDFAVWVHTQKDRGRPTISTSLDDGCGGYTGGYIYKFEIENLKEYTMNSKIMNLKGSFPWDIPLNLYLDSDKIDNTKIIGVNLNLGTFEVAFITKIEPDQIVQYKDKKTGKWMDM